MYPARFLSSLVNFIIGLAETILVFRFILKLFAANPAAPFVQWVYDTSQTLLDPFRGMFPTSVLGSGSVFEFSTLFAILIYALISYVLTEFVAWLDHSGHARVERHA